MAADHDHGDTARIMRRFAWMTFIVLAFAYFFVYFQRMSVSVVGSDIVTEVGGTIGILSSVYYWTYALMQLPCGLLTDRFGPRMSCTIFLSIASIGSLLTFCGNDFTIIVAGKIMIAAGMAVVYVPLMKLVAIWFPREDFAFLSGVVIAVGNIGAIAASGPLQVVSDAFGWRDVFLILGLITLILAILVFAIVRDDPGQRGLPRIHSTGADKVPMLKALRTVMSGGRRFWPLVLAYFLIYGTITTFQGTWAVKYFDSVYGFALSAAWMVTALGIGKILCTVVVGALTTRGVIRSKRNAMFLGTVAFTIVWATLFLLAGDVDSYVFWTAISFMFGFFGGFMSLSFTQVKEWYPVSLSGTAVSGANLFLFLGASTCTTISGAIIGTTYSLDNFAAVWGLMTLFSFIAIVLVLLSKEKCPEDSVFGLDQF